MGFFGLTKSKKSKAQQGASAATSSRDSADATGPKLAVDVPKSKQKAPSVKLQEQQQQKQPPPPPPLEQPQPTSSKPPEESNDKQPDEQSAKPPHQQKQQQTGSTTVPTTVTDIPVGDPAYATPDVTRDLVKKFISDIWNRGELELIPQVCSPKIRFNGNNGLDKIGHEGFARMVATIHSALSDYHCEIHSMVVEDNKAFCRLRFSGKHTGNLLGYHPTGRVVSWMGATEFTCSNGRILKVWELGDMKTLEEQLQSM